MWVDSAFGKDEHIAMNTQLPIWASTSEARALLASIVADPPEIRVSRSDWGSVEVYRTWKRPDVTALKRLYEEWLDREFAALDAQWEVTGFWPEHDDNPLAAERPDDLIRRLLREARDAHLVEPVSGDPFPPQARAA